MKKKSMVLFISMLAVIATVVSVFSFASSRITGDVNGDGKISTKDARLILRVTAKLDELDDEAEAAADCNFDGKVNTKDARKILRVVARLEEMSEKSDESESSNSVNEPATEPTTELTTEPTTEPVTEPTTEPVTEPTTEPVTEKDDGEMKFEDLPEDVKAFINGKFYCKGQMSSGSDMNSMTMAVDGDNIAVSMDFEGTQLMFVKVNVQTKTIFGKTKTETNYYFVNAQAKTYTEISESQMSLIGLDEDDLNISFVTVDKNKITIEIDEVNNGIYTDYKIISDNSINHFYVKDGELVKVLCCDAEDKGQSILVFDEFTGDVPASMFTVSQYKKTGLFAFFGDLISVS